MFSKPSLFWKFPSFYLYKEEYNTNLSLSKNIGDFEL